MLPKKFRFSSNVFKNFLDLMLRKGLKIQINLNRRGMPPDQKTFVEVSLNQNYSDDNFTDDIDI